MERFDIHKWKPTECRNVEEIKAALRKFNVIGKKIVSLRTIGAAENFNQWSDEYELCDNAEDSEYKTVPLRALLYEPVVFEFENGNTLEIMSKGKSTLLIASNQIPHGITEGLNHPNYDSEWFFRKIKGKSLTGRVSAIISNEHSDYFSYDTVEYGFYLDRNGMEKDFYVAFSCLNKYTNAEFALSFNTRDNICLQVPVSEYINASKNIKQIIIAEGHMTGGYFEINPLNRVEISEKHPFGADNYYKESIDIDFLDIEDYLYYFLTEYFDYNYDYGKMRLEHSEGFEPYLEFNLYTYETMHKMLSDIQSCADMLENDFENPALDKLKESFHRWNKHIEKSEEIKEKTPIAIDFYRRLVPRLQAMMNNAPDYEFICFFGP